MSAITKWWICGVCGFKNHPRIGQDAQKCEQCGGSSSDAESRDYDPAPGAS